MIRGLSFTVPQGTTDTLWQILNVVGVEHFDWYNIASQDEVWISVPGDNFFENDFYSGEDFSTLIKQKHFIIFIKLLAFNKGDEFSDVLTFKEFQDSKCQFIILINDCEFVEIYAKDPFLVKKLQENAIQKRYKDISFITDANDSRTRMRVL